MNESTKQVLSKVPSVTLGFWVVKILATTLGETGGDAVTMTLLHAHERRNWGYLVGVAVFGGALVALVVAQILAKRFHPALYWATIVASTTFGVDTVLTDTVPSDQCQSPRAANRQHSSRSDPPVYPIPSDRSAKSASVVPNVVEATIVAQ